MARSVNLPVFETELVDGGLAVAQNQSTTDLVVVIGFAAAGESRGEKNGLSQYVNQAVRINKPNEADYLYGYASDGSSVSRACHEVLGGGSNRVSVFNLGKWGEAVYVDPETEVSYPIFTSDGNGRYVINKANYYRALGYAYDILRDYMAADILWPVDAMAFDVIGEDGTDVSGRPTNFAYQLAHACYVMSTQNNECDGVINVEPAISGSLLAVAQYVGTEPTHSYPDNPDLDTITASGTGLLGEPYMVGAPSGTPGYTILPGFFEANFTADAVEYGLPPLVESEIAEDRDGYAVDIGKYISIVAEEPIYSNGAYANKGVGTYTTEDPDNPTIDSVAPVKPGGAGAYAALVSSLAPHSAPTNKSLSGVAGLRYRKSLSQLDKLDGGTPLGDNEEGSNVKYVTFKITNNAVTVTDAPTAALPSSSYARIQVHRIVKAVAKTARAIATPFIGEPNSDAMRSALETALRKAFGKMVGTALKSFNFKITASDQEKTLGKMNIELEIVPNFETRKIKFVVNMKAS